jgi:Tc toxin complex TcA C-terminal TcB-binding domain/Neuraminidase-like domain/Salmonella virulence plasmid 28.1kDa A protein
VTGQSLVYIRAGSLEWTFCDRRALSAVTESSFNPGEWLRGAEALASRNEGVDPLEADLIDRQAARSMRLADADGPEALDRVRCWQRLARIRPDAASAEWAGALVAAGITSAHEIAQIPEHAFVARFGHAFADADDARAFHARARAQRARVRQVWANVRDLVASPHHRAARFASVRSEVADYFEQIPSYQDLFGGLDYIRCEHCASIFGPAAYFLDLMRLADEYVTEPNSATIPDGYRLEQRRPDLFCLPLTCANVNQVRPILSIVNHVLAVRIAQDRAADAYQLLATLPYPFNLPFNAPLTQIRAHLSHIGTSLDQIYQEFRAKEQSVAREYLALSIEQWENLVTVSTTPEQVARLYGYPTLDVAKLARVEVFLARTGLTREELPGLLYQQLDHAELAAGAADRLFINATGEGAPYLRIVTDTSDPKKPFERIDNVTVVRLDRLSRFIRLTRTLGWSFADLDWALKSFSAAEIGDALARLSAMQRLGDRVNREPAVLASFWFEVKTIGKGSQAAPRDLFDRIFNNPTLLRGRDPYKPDSGVPFDPAQPLTWDPWGTSAADTEIRGRLTAALAVGDNDLTRAAEYLLCLRGGTPPYRGTLDTDLATLTALYRLTQIPQLAGLALADYLVLLRLMYDPRAACADRPAKDQPLTIEDAFAQLDTITWLLASPFTVGELDWIMTGRLRPGVDPGSRGELGPFVDGLATVSEPARVARASFAFEDIDDARSGQIFDQLVDAGQISKLGVVLSGPSDFAAIAPLFSIAEGAFVTNDISEAASKAAFGLLAEPDHAVIIAAAGAASGTLSPAFDRSTDISYVFPTEPHKRDEVMEQLLKVRRDIDHTVHTLSTYRGLQEVAALGGLASFLGADNAIIAVLLPYAASRAGLDDYLAALLTPDPDSAVLGKLRELVRLLARQLSLFDALSFSAGEAAAILAHPGAFNIADVASLSLDDIRSLSTFRDLVRAFSDTTGALLAFLVSDQDRSTRLAQLAALTRWDRDQLEQLAAAFWPPPSAEYGTVAGVARLRRVFDASARSGFSLQPLLTLLALSDLPLVRDGNIDPEAWKTYVDAADLTLGAVSARAGTAGFPTVSSEIGEAVDTANRDALLGAALWLLEPLGIATPSDLYQYLLIDVEASDCDAVSPIAQGIASLQLYLQRSRMALEPGVLDVPVPSVWWEWMTTYRVWEANRKVFLYPENYVDPTLRKARTPQFADLQDTLLQAEVTEATVAAGYRDYMDQLAALARLQTVATYRYSVPDEAGRTTDTLFLLARTNTSPYVYYWRTAERYTVYQKDGGAWAASADWSPWRKIDITIPAAVVTPVWAFGRLMVFWTEIQRINETVISAQESKEYKGANATTRFTFMDLSGRWVQAQQLGDSTPVMFRPDSYADQAQVSRVFEPGALAWQRPYVVHVPPDSWTQPAPFDNAEQLFVLYGAALRFLQNLPVPNPGKPTETPFERENELNNDIWANVQARAALQKVPASGYVAIKPAWSQAINLLHQPRDCVLLDQPPNILVYPSPYTGQIDVGQRQLFVQKFSGLLATELLFDQQNPPARPAGLSAAGGATTAADPDSVLLLSNLAETNTALWTVKNQIGWFVFDNGDDVFLVASQQQPLQQTSPLVRFSYQPSNLPAGNWVYAYTMPFTAPYSDLNTIKFAVTRLGTHTIDALSAALLTGGLPALLSPHSQRTPELPLSRFAPNAANVIDTTTATLDFAGAYGPYFWELFFHGPFLVAERLRTSGRYDDARRWFQYVFDPTAANEADDEDVPADSPTDRYWRFLPFRGLKLQTLAEVLTDVQQIAAYNDDPFDPDAIARLRPGAYPKAIVMRYIDNLVAWADALFTQDTRETITQATNLYVLAADLLGPRPAEVGEFETPAPRSYRQIRDAYDTSGQARGGTGTTITLAETASATDGYYDGLTVCIVAGTGAGQQRTIGSYAGTARVATVTVPWLQPPDAGSEYRIIGIPQFLIDLENSRFARPGAQVASIADVPFNDIHSYFCVPENETLVGYWDTIEDRLYKIRHCMNILGVERPLALFEPPIEPGALIRRAIAGGGFTVQRTAEPPVPFYRFSVVLEKAKEYTTTLIQLGSSLLAALEQVDAGELDLIRLAQERQVLTMTTRVRQDQIDELIQAGAALGASRAGAQARKSYYTGLVSAGLSASELANLVAMEAALQFNLLASITKTASSIGYAVPQVGSPFAMTYGGQQLGNVLNAMSGVFEIGSFVANYIAQRTQTTAGYERRAADWQLQADIASRDVEQIDYQLAGNDLGRKIAEREYEILQRQIAQNDELDAFYRHRFTNRELFQWMANRLSTVYFQTYALAMDLARAAQRAYQYEYGNNDTFINLEYRDPAYRGLLAGEGLMLSLNQMESAYIAHAFRTLEIEKTISLMQLNPLALLKLRETGECTFELTERLFDQDYPGQYARKIKTITVSLPALLGPYQNVHATLTQLSSQVVLKAEPKPVEYLLGLPGSSAPDQSMLRTNWWVNQRIALSSGLNDSGLFELSFSDPSYLPFEGTGAVSTWRLSMPQAANRFDYSAIADVVISLKYTALPGDEPFRRFVQGLEPVKTYASGAMFAVAQQFSAQWFAFMQDHADPAQQTLSFPIGASIVPPGVGDATMTAVYLQLITDVDASSAAPYLTLSIPGQSGIDVPIGPGNSQLIERRVRPFAGGWSLTFKLGQTPAALKRDGFLDPRVLRDIVLVVDYTGTLTWNR